MYFGIDVCVVSLSTHSRLCVYLLVCDCDLCNSTGGTRIGRAAFSLKPFTQKDKAACRHPSPIDVDEAYGGKINISHTPALCGFLCFSSAGHTPDHRLQTLEQK